MAVALKTLGADLVATLTYQDDGQGVELHFVDVDTDAVYPIAKFKIGQGVYLHPLNPLAGIATDGENYPLVDGYVRVPEV